MAGRGRSVLAASVAALAIGLAVGPRAWAQPLASDVTGGLATPGATVSGYVSLSFEVTGDADAASAALIVDGTTVQTDEMDVTGDADFELDTATLKDGSHYLQATVTDSDGDTTVVWEGGVVTDNAPAGGQPAVYGDAQVGQTLVAGDGTWAPAPTGFSYQWLLCNPGGSDCGAIPGATSPSYTIAAADAYDQIAVTVIASDFSGSGSATSSRSGVIADADGYLSPPPAPALLAGQAPQVSGKDAAGAVLTAAPGGWSNGPLSYSYHWQRCDRAGLGCVPIPGATRATYTLVAADADQRLRVVVSASGPGGTSVAESDPTRLIADAAGAGAAPGSEVSPGTPNGTGACARARLRVRFDSGSSVTVDLGRSATVRGSLRCGTRPIARATLAVAVAPLGGPGPTRHATVITTAAGRFDYVLGPGPSRRISVSYDASADEASAAAHASATMLVTPSISLAITPTRTTNGHTITFRGTVSGGHEPPAGVTLDIEYLEGRRWMIYDTVRANPGSGRFVWRYTFRRTTESITYWFRVAIPASGVPGYPFEPAASPERSVHVDP